MPIERVQVDDKGRVVIPNRFRKALIIKTGDTIEMFLYKNSLVLRLLTPELAKALCIGCGKTEDDVKMKLKSTDGRIGICETCYGKGLRMKEVNVTK